MFDTHCIDAADRAEDILNADPIIYTCPGDLIADVIHYCRAKGIDFDDELRKAWGYVRADTASDIEHQGY